MKTPKKAPKVWECINCHKENSPARMTCHNCGLGNQLTIKNALAHQAKNPPQQAKKPRTLTGVRKAKQPCKKCGSIWLEVVYFPSSGRRKAGTPIKCYQCHNKRKSADIAPPYKGEKRPSQIQGDSLFESNVWPYNRMKIKKA